MLEFSNILPLIKQCNKRTKLAENTCTYRHPTEKVSVRYTYSNTTGLRYKIKIAIHRSGMFRLSFDAYTEIKNDFSITLDRDVHAFTHPYNQNLKLFGKFSKENVEEEVIRLLLLV